MPLARRPWRIESHDFSTSVSYPDREAIGQIFGEHSPEEIRSNSALRARIENYLHRMIRNVLIAHRAQYLHFHTPGAADFTAEEIFVEVVGTNRERYAVKGILERVQEAFIELLPSEIQKLPEDEFKRAIQDFT